jgi:hypothetical protein
VRELSGVYVTVLRVGNAVVAALSCGQKQSLAIVGARLRNPTVYTLGSFPFPPCFSISILEDGEVVEHRFRYDLEAEHNIQPGQEGISVGEFRAMLEAPHGEFPPENSPLEPLSPDPYLLLKKVHGLLDTDIHDHDEENDFMLISP